MKQFILTTKMFILMLMVTAVFLAACNVETAPVEITQIPLSASPTVNLTITEVEVKIVTPEPTPTTAVCTPLPAEMTLDIQYESDLHGTIEVTGLQPGEKPIVIITGDSLTGSYREESTTVREVGVDGRFQHTFDFRSWPSVEGYTFKGQIIHQRGAACFDLEIPFVDEAGEAGRTINGRLVAAEDETQPLPGVLLRLEPDGEPVTQTDGNGRLRSFWM